MPSSKVLFLVSVDESGRVDRAGAAGQVRYVQQGRRDGPDAPLHLQSRCGQSFSTTVARLREHLCGKCLKSFQRCAKSVIALN